VLLGFDRDLLLGANGALESSQVLSRESNVSKHETISR